MCISVAWIICVIVHLFPYTPGSACLHVCECGPLLIPRCTEQVATLLSHELNDRQGRPFTTAHTHILMCHHSFDDWKSAESKSSLCAFNQVSLKMCTYVCKFSCVWMIEHMCVYHDASPQLSHSFPLASRGWKQVKPQTSGAPQPIRIVYLASHSRLAEQEHTASHTALQG